MLKKLIILILALTITLTAVGCSKKLNGQNAESTVEKQVSTQNTANSPESSYTEKTSSETQPNINEGEQQNQSGDTGKESSQVTDKGQGTQDNSQNSKKTDTAVKPSKKPGTTSKPQKKPGTSSPNKPGTPEKKPVKPPVTEPEKPATKPDTPDNGGQTEKPAETNVAVKDIADKIINDVVSQKLALMPDEFAEECYPFDRSITSEYVIYQVPINIKSDELAIFKVKDINKMGEIEKAINKRLEQLNNIWESYLPAQYEKVKNYIVKKKGNYIMFAITDDQDKAAEIFNSFFNK